MFRTSLQEIRRPVFRKIALDTLDRSSSLYTHYLRRSLTPEVLVSSSEDWFTVAFYYDMQFDVLDYLRHLRKQEITNVSYNIMKNYLRSRSKEEIVDFTSSDNAGDNTLTGVCLSVLRGELYRIRDFSFDGDAGLLSEYVIFGAITIHESCTPNFDTLFDMFIERYPRLVDLLDVGNKQVANALARNIQTTYPYLLDSGIIYGILDVLDVNVLPRSRIACLFSNERLDRKTKAEIVGKMLLKITSLEVFLECAIDVSEDVCMFNLVVDQVLNRARGKSGGCVRLLAVFCHVIFYHTGTDVLDGANPKYPVDQDVRNFALGDMAEFVRSSDLHSTNREIRTMGTRFSRVAELYAKYAQILRKHVPAIDDVLDLPERFFLLSLDAINTEQAALLREFHTNLMHDRIKEKVSRTINREILAKYLIKRHIWFKMDMDEHVGMMSDRYKMMYAANNLEWAFENIELLRKIGISRQLYSRLLKSKFKGCLTSTDKVSYSNFLLRDRPDYMNDYVGSLDASKENAANIVFRWDGPCAGRKKPEGVAVADGEAVEPDVDGNAKRPRVGINGVLAALFESIKTGSPDYAEAFRQVETDADYFYIMDSLFQWVRETNCLRSFGAMFDGTVPFYRIKYEDFKCIVGRVIQKYGDHGILTNVVSSLDCSDIQSVISDYPGESGFVSDGIRAAYERCLGTGGSAHACILGGKTREDRCAGDIAAVVEKLVFSHKNDEILVGIKAFSCLQSPPFAVGHLLASTSDLILEEVTKHIERGSHNEAILRLVFTRGVLDTISADLIKKLDIERVQPADLNRIYSLFYIAPLVYVTCEIYQYGFALNDNMVIELVGVMSTIYDRALFDRISLIIGDFCFSSACFNSMIHRLDVRNILFRRWAVERLVKMDTISLPYFVKLCLFIANEDDLAVVRGGIDALKQVCSHPGNADHGCAAQIRGLVSKWSENKRLAQLTRRVYPLFMADPVWYSRVLGECSSREEVEMLRSAYKINTE